MKRRIKILFLGMSPNKGGIEKIALALFQNISGTRIQIDFLTSHKEIAYENVIKSLDGKIYRVNLHKGIEGILKNIKTYYRFFKDHPEYTIVHNNLMSFYHIEALIAQKLARVPIRIVHARGSKITYDSLKIKVVHCINKPIALLCANKYFACSRDAGVFMFNENIIRGKNYKWIKNGIQLENFRFNLEARKKTREQLGLNNKIVYGHVGAFLPVKNHKFLLEIFKELLVVQENAHLVLIGDGILKSDCIKYADSLNISSNISFLGSIDNVNDLLCTMDNLIFPSISEGFGNVLIEAQATGLPCYISDNIPSEVNITNLIKRIPLSCSAKEWAEVIQNSQMINEREMFNKIIEENGFNIKDIAIRLQDYYLSNGDENYE
ncbi:MAG: glycosyltransferase [Peptoniphilaceae bacterium]